MDRRPADGRDRQRIRRRAGDRGSERRGRAHPCGAGRQLPDLLQRRPAQALAAAATERRCVAHRRHGAGGVMPEYTSRASEVFAAVRSFVQWSQADAQGYYSDLAKTLTPAQNTALTED